MVLSLNILTESHGLHLTDFATDSVQEIGTSIHSRMIFTGVSDTHKLLGSEL